MPAISYVPCMPGLYEIAIKGLIVQPRGVLLLQRPGIDGLFWDTPGGRLELGESFETTLKRELAEEIGWTGSYILGPIVGTQLWERPGKQAKVLLFFRLDADVETVVLSDEHVGYAWVQPEALESVDQGCRLEPELRDILRTIWSAQ